MAEDRQSFSIKEDKSGTVHVAGEVVAIIAGLAATEPTNTIRSFR